MDKVIVFGASGQLGQCLKKVCANQGLDHFIFPDEGIANILDIECLAALFEQFKPGYCINCAAYTDVDKAEDDTETARKINCEGAFNIAALCDKYNIVLLQISTDFVFKGDVPHLLTEKHTPGPINVYGLTKLEGERAVAAATNKYFIIRTSWLYSEYGNNFVKTMLKLSAERSEINIIADQIGTPTYGMDLAAALVAIILSGSQAYGIYHYSNEGVTSWYDFAKGIFSLAAADIKVNPVKTSEYVTRAFRPPFSVMDKSKIKKSFNLAIPYWRDSLAECIQILTK